MDLSSWLTRPAVAAAHVLVVECPGWWRTRVALEQAATHRGWTLASTPADADVLAVAGPPGPRLSEAIARVWQQMPGPRTRVDAMDPTATGPALGEAAVALADTDAHRRDARTRTPDPTAGAQVDEMHPAGIPLAGGAQDRDGLEMDALPVPLGPVLAHWPAGLVLHTTLAGDVITAAHVEILTAGDPAHGEPGSRRHERAWRCDGAADLLALAGWPEAAAAARRARDLCFDDTEAECAQALTRRLHRRVARSWTLRAMLRTDVRARLLGMLEPTAGEQSVAGGAAADALAGLVTGLELAAARLAVASVHPDTATAAREASAGA